MKIYSKKGFISGLITLLVFIIGVISVVLKGLSIKMSILLPILFLFSITEIRRSLSKAKSKEDFIKNEDERDKYILLKTSQKSLKILEGINMIIVIISMISYAVTKNIFLMGIFVLSSAYITLIFVVELATNIYYEKHE